jgi:hypothetical protein
VDFAEEGEGKVNTRERPRIRGEAWQGEAEVPSTVHQTMGF